MAPAAFGIFGPEFHNLAKVTLVQDSNILGTAGTGLVLDNIVGTYETTS